MLNINEIFYTIQGEGPLVGTPSIFVRLAGCNLRCYWCDTSYTWLYSETTADKVRSNLPTKLQETVHLEVYDKEQETHPTSIEDIIEKIGSYPGTHVVITGGEPLLQKERVLELTNHLLESNYTIEIETNGTISPAGMSEQIHFNVSPKLQNSYNPLDRRYKPEILEEFVNIQANFKFVVSQQTDMEEIDKIISHINIPHHQVFLMPEGRTPQELQEKSPWLIEICKSSNYQYTHRLHIDLFDKKRGV